MSIEKIKGSIDGYSAQNLLSGRPAGNRAYLSMPQDSTSFTGAAAKPVQAAKSLKDFLLEIMPKKIKRMVKIHEGMGEVQNQLINAVGTGLVAPLFIKYNPISDTDENTRTYTAWRQPVSAVLAVATQAAIVVPFNSLIKKLSDVGFLPVSHNSTLFPSDDYVKAIIKKQNPDKKYTKAEMKDAIEKYNKEVYEPKLTKMIEEDRIVFNTTDGKTMSTMEMPKQDFKNLFEETLNTLIETEKNERRLAINQKLPKKIDRGIFFHDHPDETINILQRIRSKVSQDYAQTEFERLPENKIQLSNKDFENECKQIIKELKDEIKKDSSKKSVNEELIKIVKEIRDKNTSFDSPGIRVLCDKIDKMIESVHVMQSKKSTKEISDYLIQSEFYKANSYTKTWSIVKN